MKELWLFPVLLSEESAIEDVLPQGVTVHFSGISTFMVENIRSARRFLTSLKQGIVIDDCTFFLLDKNTTEDEVRVFLANQSGRIGVMSEAGCPGIADPGSLAVRWAHQMGWKVKPLVGPTSIALGLMASGMSGQSFVFHGYLPIEAKDRQGKIRSLVQAVQKLNQTQIFIETPYRNQALLAALLQEVPPNVRLCIGCNLTAANEWIWAGTVADWRKKALPEGKWPAIFLLGQ